LLEREEIERHIREMCAKKRFHFTRHAIDECFSEPEPIEPEEVIEAWRTMWKLLKTIVMTHGVTVALC